MELRSRSAVARAVRASSSASTSSSQPSPLGSPPGWQPSKACGCVTGNQLYRRIFDFWLKIFALSFGMGVVSGIVMAFQFGTNWSVLAERTGSIQGPLLGYEAFTAFMLEATFFGVMLLGRDRVPPWFYFLSCCMVSLGTMFSSFWILANNSWMQVPLGHTIVDGRIIPGGLVGDHDRTDHAGALAAYAARRLSDNGHVHGGHRRLVPAAWQGRAEGARDAELGPGTGRGADPDPALLRPLDGPLRAQASAGEVRGDRGALEDPAAGKRGADRSARSVRGAESLCDRNPAGSAASSPPATGPSREIGLETFPPKDRPSVHHSVLRVPHHGGNGPDHARGILVWKLSALARPAGEHSLVSVGGVPRPSRPASSPSSPAGSPPKSAASLG